MTLEEMLDAVGDAYGDLGGWWPADSPFEVAVGAFLVQAVTWRQASQAVTALMRAGLLTPAALAGAYHGDVAALIRPALYHQQKARYLQRFAGFVRDELGGDILTLRTVPSAEQEKLLRRLPGIGQETAAAIMAYALGQAVPVLDAYALRILPRIGAIGEGDARDGVREAMTRAIGGDARTARLLHAAIVELGRLHCRPEPLCASCPLTARCPKVLGHPADGRRDRPASNAGRAASHREAGDAGRDRAAPT